VQYDFSDNVQRIFKHGGIQDNNLLPDKVLNTLMASSYKGIINFSKQCSFFGTPCTYRCDVHVFAILIILWIRLLLQGLQTLYYSASYMCSRNSDGFLIDPGVASSSPRSLPSLASSVIALKWNYDETTSLIRRTVLL